MPNVLHFRPTITSWTQNIEQAGYATGGEYARVCNGL
mgnify:CR=1 FL=1